MAPRKIFRTNANNQIIIRKNLAFSLLECLLTASLLLVLMQVMLATLFLNYKITKQINIYTKYLNNAQYLYWFFTTQINNYITINNIPDNIALNNKLIANKLLANEPAPLEIVSINTIPAYLHKKISKSSSIFRINNFIINNEQIIPNSKIYYIGKTALEKLALYQYENNYSNQLIDDIEEIQVTETIRNNNKYYIFNVLFTQDNSNLPNEHHKIAFVIANNAAI